MLRKDSKTVDEGRAGCNWSELFELREWRRSCKAVEMVRVQAGRNGRRPTEYHRDKSGEGNWTDEKWEGGWTNTVGEEGDEDP